MGFDDEYWHNKEKFYVHRIVYDECKRVNRCESCKVDFPEENPKIDSDLVVVHKERYMRPNFDSFGKRGEPFLTTQLGRKFYCVKKKCLFLTTSLLLERQIVYVEISQFKTITRTFRVFKKGLHFDMTAAILEQ